MSDFEYFNYFNIELNYGLKKKLYDNLNRLTNYKYSLYADTLNSDEMKALWTAYATALYPTTGVPSGKTPMDIVGQYFTTYEQKGGIIDSVPIHPLSEIDVFISPTYRIMWVKKPITTANIFCNNLFIDQKYYLNKLKFPFTTLSFDKWVDLTPTTVINLCSDNRNISSESIPSSGSTTSDTDDNNRSITPEVFYYKMMNYKSDTDTGKLVTQPLKFDAMGNLATSVVCSLRLVNSGYKGRCCKIDGIVDPIGFDKSTGMIDMSLLTKPPYKITAWYNQMTDGSEPFFTANVANAPSLVILDIDGYRVPNIEWTQDTWMDYSQSLGKYNTLTVCSSVRTNSTRTSTFPQCLYILQPGNNVFLKTNEIGTSISNVGISSLSMQKTWNDHYLHTFSVDFLSSGTKYIFDKKEIIPIIGSGCLSDGQSSKTLFKSDRDKSSDNIYTLYSPQIIVFSTDDVSVPMNVLDQIADDVTSVWVNPYSYSTSSDLRCITMVPEACSIDRHNEGCACYPMFIDPDSKSKRQIQEIIENTTLVNTDPWCLYPKCADIKAYKNPLKKLGSTCSSNCIAGLFANPGKYSSLNMSDIQLVTACNNKNGITSLGSGSGGCDPACKDGTICSPDPDDLSKVKCLPSMACTQTCKSGYQCVIDKDNVQQCIPSSAVTKCVDSDICKSGEYCDTSLNLCMPSKKSVNIVIPILIFFGILISGCVGFIIYRKQEPFFAKSNIMIAVIVLLIAITVTCIYMVAANQYRNIFAPILVFLGILLLGYAGFLVYRKIRKVTDPIWTRENMKVGLAILSIAIIMTIIYIIVSRRMENYTKEQEDQINNVCYSDNECSGENVVCLNNTCHCKIGYNGDKNIGCVKDYTDIICTSLPYLPHSTLAGIYFYTTIINDTIYVFAVDGNFKYDGDKWVEISRLDNQLVEGTTSQIGFHPYVSLVPRYIDVTKYSLNSNMCGTYDKKVCVFVPDHTMMNTTDNTPSSYQSYKSFLALYDSDMDIWSKSASNDIFDHITTYNALGLNTNPDSKYNNVITAIVDNIFYIFGGMLLTDHSTAKVATLNQTVGKYDIEADKWDTIIIEQKMIYNSYSKAYVSRDKQYIYIIGGGILTTGMPTATSCNDIYQFNIKTGEMKSLVNINVPSTYPDVKTNNGAWTSYYFTALNDKQETEENIVIIGTISNVISPIYVYNITTNTQSTAKFANLSLPLSSALFNAKADSGNFLIGSSTCMFILNEFLFIVTGGGEIFRCNNYNTKNLIIDLEPCYGLSKYGKPVYNTQQYVCKSGYVLGSGKDGHMFSCYKTIFANITDKQADICCSNKSGFMCADCRSGGTCGSFSKPTICGVDWTATHTGSCSSNCGVVCTTTPNTEDNYYQCDKGSTAEDSKWVKTSTSSWGNMTNSSGRACNPTNNEGAKYCKIPAL